MPARVAACHVRRMPRPPFATAFVCHGRYPPISKAAACHGEKTYGAIVRLARHVHHPNGRRPARSPPDEILTVPSGEAAKTTAVTWAEKRTDGSSPFATPLPSHPKALAAGFAVLPWEAVSRSIGVTVIPPRSRRRDEWSWRRQAILASRRSPFLHMKISRKKRKLRRGAWSTVY